jgi:uncharacterized membrane protein YhhN
MPWLALPLAVTVCLLGRAENRGLQAQIYVFKPVSTLLVIAVAAQALGRPGGNVLFTHGVLLGLLLSLGGDVALMFQQRPRAFLIGLVLFLLGHIAYAATFAVYGARSDVNYLALGLLLPAFGFYRLLAPGLGRMRWPVVAYMLVISGMVAAAFTLLANPAVPRAVALLALAGAVLFYLSDVILAANRFWRPLWWNRYSLFLYFGGQLLIAMAPGRLLV